MQQKSFNAAASSFSPADFTEPRLKLRNQRTFTARFLISLVAIWFCLASLPIFARELPSEFSVLETSLLRLRISESNGHCELLDKRTGMNWGAEDPESPFGTATLKVRGRASVVNLARCTLQHGRGNNSLTASFYPGTNEGPAIIVEMRILPDQRTVQVEYRCAPELKLESIAPLNTLIAVSGTGYVVVPAREGMLVPANSGLAFTQRFDTYAYEGCHMEMLGAVQSNSAALVTWEDPYVAAELKSVVSQTNSTDHDQQVFASLHLSQSARTFRIGLLGQGGYVEIARAYREVARKRGYLVSWAEKLKANPERAKLFGAANIKLWSALDRHMNEESTKEELVRTNWTFAEVGEVAEHFKKDLHLDRVLFTLGGWIHRGYDNQHPDILLTAPECGGDAAFSECARRVQQQGYLFCLHDNYQDIYRDSPSWNEKFVMKTWDGKLARGGHWAGGLAFLTCSKEALELAERPQNLAAVKKLSDANSYFIDTTYAAGLQECFDPQHPLTRGDDLHWKQALSDYARGVFGIFGSECGREWAIPHSDFFEGLTGVSGGPYHNAKLLPRVGGTVIPLFDLVYRDCIAMYGKYGYDAGRAADYVLQHLVFGRPLNYHAIPPHLYWKASKSDAQALNLAPGVAAVERLDSRHVKISYRWSAKDSLLEDWQVFVHFTDADGNIKFQGDYRPSPPATQWKPGENLQGPFTLEIPAGVSGPVEVRMGLYQPDTGKRALLRGLNAADRAYVVGRLKLSVDKVEFQAHEPGLSPEDNLDLFTRADQGWAADLNETDRFIKNTYEVLSPLNEMTAQMQMTDHSFLTPDRKVQRSIFGDGAQRVVVTVNFGKNDSICQSTSGGTVHLPQRGFLVDGPQFVAFYSKDWSGHAFTTPSLFTLRSLDRLPLNKSRQVRVFHGFGDSSFWLERMQFAVTRESIIHPEK